MENLSKLYMSKSDASKFEEGEEVIAQANPDGCLSALLGRSMVEVIIDDTIVTELVKNFNYTLDSGPELENMQIQNVYFKIKKKSQIS